MSSTSGRRACGTRTRCTPLRAWTRSTCRLHSRVARGRGRVETRAGAAHTLGPNLGSMSCRVTPALSLALNRLQCLGPHKGPVEQGLGLERGFGGRVREPLGSGVGPPPVRGLGVGTTGPTPRLSRPLRQRKKLSSQLPDCRITHLECKSTFFTHPLTE